MPKAEVRALAEDMGLVVAKKADSQDICFVPQGRYADIISKVKPNAALAGEIVHIDGRVLGRHEGIVHYTIGQRKGLGVATGEPLYVVYLDARSRRVIVGPREALDTHRVYLRDVNWIGDGSLEADAADGFACFAKVRSTRPPAPAVVHCDDRGVYVDLAVGEAGVAPGQACVLYSAEGPDARVYGGGFIERSERAADAEASLKALLSTPVAA
jgi:tRNA-specific 2-thiouridylase